MVLTASPGWADKNAVVVLLTARGSSKLVSGKYITYLILIRPSWRIGVSVSATVVGLIPALVK